MSIGKTDKQPEQDGVERVKLRYIRFGWPRSNRTVPSGDTRNIYFASRLHVAKSIYTLFFSVSESWSRLYIFTHLQP